MRDKLTKTAAALLTLWLVLTVSALPALGEASGADTPPEIPSGRAVYKSGSEDSAPTDAASGQSASAEEAAALDDPDAPVCRALLIGELTYEETGRTRMGGGNTVRGMADMLEQQSVDGLTYQTTVALDTTREELLRLIDETFAGAEEDDLSLFYINCHGDCVDTAWLELHDGTRVTAVQLEELLGAVPGRVMVILDCCRSGAFLEKGFGGLIGEAFAGGLKTGKYIVLTSADADEESYRRGFTNAGGEDGTATVLARSLCEGAGWDLIADRPCTLKADFNRDSRVTAAEMSLYVSRRARYYLDGTGVTQTVRMWPDGDETVLFGREE